MGVYGKQIAAESKRLASININKIQGNIRKATKQAGDGGFSIIDGTGIGATKEQLHEGLDAFIRNLPSREGAGKSGTIILLYGESGMDVVKF